jgi:nitrogen fixation protein FixH
MSVDLVLQAFDSSFVLTQQAVLPDLSYALDVSAEITLTQQISASDLSGVFFFKTDEDITSLPTDSSYVEYYVDRSQLTGGAATLNPFNGTVTNNHYVAGDHLGKDFLRDMAQQLFNTHFGVDLFTNEDAVITDISTKSDTVAADIFTLIGNVDKTNGINMGGTNGTYGKYKKDDISNTNLCREILNQLLTLSPTRFADKTTIRKDAATPGVYGMPFVAGDTISYKLSVTAHPSQNTTVNTGKGALTTRTYKVIFVVA